jgi:hypothetical protein
MAIAPVRQGPASWRDTLSIHPAAELFPLMAPSELAALGADIKTNGLINPIVLWLASKDAPAQLLDGRSRLDAIEIELGGPVRVTSRTFRGRTVWGLEADDNGCPTFVANLLGNENCSLDARAVIVLDPGIDPYAYAISANIHRRHLTAGQKREAIANLLKADPTRSDRQIAEVMKVDHKTVAPVRAEQEARGEIPHVTIRTDSRGRQQLAQRDRRSAPKAKDVAPPLSSLAWSAALPGERQAFLDKIGWEAIRAAIPGTWDVAGDALRTVTTEALLAELARRKPAQIPNKQKSEVTVLGRGHRHAGVTLDITPTEETTTQH